MITPLTRTPLGHGAARPRDETPSRPRALFFGGARTAALALSLLCLAGCDGALDASRQGQAHQYSSSIPSVGVAACDDYIAQYESCVISQLPSWQQNQALTGLQKTRDQWFAQADSNFKKEALGRVCTHATEAAAREYSNWSCPGS